VIAATHDFKEEHSPSLSSRTEINRLNESQALRNSFARIARSFWLPSRHNKDESGKPLGLEIPIFSTAPEASRPSSVTAGTTSKGLCVEIMPSTKSQWHEMIEEYTARELTQESDRLAAIFGVASAMASHTQAHYLAGLWTDSFLFDLYWSADSTLKSATVNAIAPSWSWAANSGRIQYPSSADDHCQIAILLDWQLDGTAARQKGHVTVRGDVRKGYAMIQSGKPAAIRLEQDEDSNIIPWQPDEDVKDGCELQIIDVVAALSFAKAKYDSPRCNAVYALVLKQIPETIYFHGVGLSTRLANNAERIVMIQMLNKRQQFTSVGNNILCIT